ncbi:MAG: SDR family NAD(P)-dependent oxidoreductase [Vicingus serpentipes]|nr:SDR family NAD(P)-dependent oxidoreductase [Vicingus serpentipes]
MNYFFITGSSKGLGKALSELLLKDNSNYVYGFARNCSIEHVNYHHTTIDFNNLDAVQNYSFPELDNVEKLVLVNNAGLVGDVKHVGKIDPKQIILCYNVNLVAPAIITNNFISTYGDNTLEKLIINISSGAGRSAIDGWNVYCSAKSGIDMFSQVLNEEIKIDNSNIKVLSLAPGIIDTDMQVQIRAADQTNFSNIAKFIEYKKGGDLSSPEATASLVHQIIETPTLLTNVLCSVRDISS